MQHALILDSIAFDTLNGYSFIAVFGRDPAPHPGSLLICLDTTRSIPASGEHLITDLPEVIGAPESGDRGAFAGSLYPTSTPHFDSLYIVAYAINPVEGQEGATGGRPADGNWPPEYRGYRTAGPPSNTIAVAVH